jgi:hypothetical protein
LLYSEVRFFIVVWSLNVGFFWNVVAILQSLPVCGPDFLLQRVAKIKNSHRMFSKGIVCAVGGITIDHVHKTFINKATTSSWSYCHLLIRGVIGCKGPALWVFSWCFQTWVGPERGIPPIGAVNLTRMGILWKYNGTWFYII